MKQTSLRCLFSLVLAVLLCGTAGAAKSTETEQVLLTGDKVAYEAETTEFKEVDGIPTVLKTFVLPPEVDPELLREEPFTQFGYKFVYDRMEKTDQMTDDVKEVSETLTIDTLTNRLQDVIQVFPATRDYDADEYSGKLNLDVSSIKLDVTQYNTITDSQPHQVTKVYSLPYNDRSKIPQTIESDGLTLPLTSLTWSEEIAVQGSDVPTGYTATAVYSAVTTTSRQVESGYRATATYRGNVSKSDIDSIKYVVRYIGTPILVIPDLPTNTSNIEADQLDEADENANETSLPFGVEEPIDYLPYVLALIGVCIVLIVVWYIRWHTVTAYAHNPKHHVNFATSRHFVNVSSPKIKLESYKGHEETAYTISVPKHLAKKLIGEDIIIASSGGYQIHKVRAFVGKAYTFHMIIPKK